MLAGYLLRYETIISTCLMYSAPAGQMLLRAVRMHGDSRSHWRANAPEARLSVSEILDICISTFLPEICSHSCFPPRLLLLDLFRRFPALLRFLCGGDTRWGQRSMLARLMSQISMNTTHPYDDTFLHTPFKARPITQAAILDFPSADLLWVGGAVLLGGASGSVGFSRTRGGATISSSYTQVKVSIFSFALELQC